jgi:hypothetical protein
MKLSTKLLAGIAILTVASLVASNRWIKDNYARSDKDDPYWEYRKILELPFRYIRIEGGNIAQIAFEQNERPSVRVLRNWPGYEMGWVKAVTRADTLFITFSNNIQAIPKLLEWMKHTTLVRIFAPELVAIEGIDTRFDLLKLHQKSIAIHLSGRSETEVESDISSIDTLRITEKDSSHVYFEMSPDVVGSHLIRVGFANLDIRGASRLDLGPVQMKSYKLDITDSAVVGLSGFSFKNTNK